MTSDSLMCLFRGSALQEEVVGNKNNIWSQFLSFAIYTTWKAQLPALAFWGIFINLERKTYILHSKMSVLWSQCLYTQWQRSDLLRVTIYSVLTMCKTLVYFGVGATVGGGASFGWCTTESDLFIVDNLSPGQGLQESVPRTRKM